MKKKAGILAIILAASFALGACGKYPALKVPGTPDYSCAVVSNGGTAVQLGNYVYFINGRGETTVGEGAFNVFGDVQKGGIYRITMNNAEKVTITADDDPYLGYYGVYPTYRERGDAEHNYTDPYYSGFEMFDLFDDDDEPILDDDEVQMQQVRATHVVAKTAYNGKDTTAGLFIFDDWIYYASPNNLKNKVGAVQSDLVDFYRTHLNGKGTQLIYTTKDTGSVQWGVYKYDGKTFLNVYEAGASTLTNVEMTAKRVSKARVIAEKVTGAYFPRKPVYYEGISEDGLEDFVYFTRAPKADDRDTGGNVVERIRPDGDVKSSVKLFNTGRTVTIESVKYNTIFYTQDESTGITTMFASDLAGIAKNNNEETPEAETVVREIGNTGNISVLFTGVYFTRDIDSDYVAKSYYMVATRGSTTVRIVDDGSETVVLNSAVTLAEIYGNTFYFVKGTGEQEILYRAEIFGNNQAGEQITSGAITYNNYLPVDICADRLFFINSGLVVPGFPEVTLSGYLHTLRIEARAGEKEFFVGQISDEEMPEEEEEEE